MRSHPSKFPPLVHSQGRSTSLTRGLWQAVKIEAVILCVLCVCVRVCTREGACAWLYADMCACGGGQRLMSPTVLGCSSLYSLWTRASHFSQTAWPRISAFPALGLAVAPAHPPGIRWDWRDLELVISYTAFITMPSPQSISGYFRGKKANLNSK